MTSQWSARAVVLRQADLAHCLGGVCRREPVLVESLWNHLLQRQSLISVAEYVSLSASARIDHRYLHVMRGSFLG